MQIVKKRKRKDEQESKFTLSMLCWERTILSIFIKNIFGKVKKNHCRSYIGCVNIGFFKSINNDRDLNHA